MAGGSLEEQLAEAVATIKALRAENEALRDELAALKSLLGADSSTTSKPPSGDPVATRKKRAERRGEERVAKQAQGKQPGAPGRSLQRCRPDRRIEHEAPACSCCGADLSGAPVIGTEVRQVIDLPRVTPTVTDHIVYKRRCACGTVTAGEMPPEARAPVCWGPEVRAFAL
ncbi:zinc-finger binding domain of transposase IS66 [Ferrithrix thermotolerans DSM 19514]|uniref:Zinc-finger binding domain of transposase IS66 n=1 Tax=Ferrithrix thermotolerans DSM 19514 TaxID=1121881 RepID=A0A1M4YA53_9ACTN|nr:IS66 family transposase zinc-finger binding domain-containing protein [Ferrithrix thermotolerans]SHF02513.1 zinc-finger binding domain of transposase IS66 [Ferrithrix thermotolerans DSM 19514]